MTDFLLAAILLQLFLIFDRLSDILDAIKSGDDRQPKDDGP